jgi:hypothetical protein
MKRVLSAILTLMVCSISLAGNPNPTHSKYVSTLGGGFLINEGKARYAMTFKVSEELARPLYVVVKFDNPENRKEDLLSTLVYESGGDLVIQSEPFSSAKNGKTYRLELKFFSDPEHYEQVARHKAKVKFNLSPEVAKIVGIKLL